jgi:hypothetical protein
MERAEKVVELSSLQYIDIDPALLDLCKATRMKGVHVIMIPDIGTLSDVIVFVVTKKNGDLLGSTFRMTLAEYKGKELLPLLIDRTIEKFKNHSPKRIIVQS